MLMLRLSNQESLLSCIRVSLCKIFLKFGIRLRSHGRMSQEWPTSIRGLLVITFRFLAVSFLAELPCMMMLAIGRRPSKQHGMTTSVWLPFLWSTLIHLTWSQRLQRTWLLYNLHMSTGSVLWSPYMTGIGILKMALICEWSLRRWTPFTFPK